MKKKVISPNIVRGGQAIPLGNNFYYMNGRKHSQGGIDIGNNPRTGLEVEGGEIVQMSPKEVKVYSSVPFLNGKSPAEKVLGGENPTTVFRQQEQFKDRNGINDDGTKAKWGKKTAIEAAETIGGYLPFIGTALDIKELIKNPSWEQAGWTALGLASDLATGGSARAVFRTARNLKRAKEAINTVNNPLTRKLYKEAAMKEIISNTNAKKGVIRDAAMNIGQNYVQNKTQKRFGGKDMIIKVNGNVRNGLIVSPSTGKRIKRPAGGVIKLSDLNKRKTKEVPIKQEIIPVEQDTITPIKQDTIKPVTNYSQRSSNINENDADITAGVVLSPLVAKILAKKYKDVAANRKANNYNYEIKTRTRPVYNDYVGLKYTLKPKIKSAFTPISFGRPNIKNYISNNEPIGHNISYTPSKNKPKTANFTYERIKYQKARKAASNIEFYYDESRVGKQSRFYDRVGRIRREPVYKNDVEKRRWEKTYKRVVGNKEPISSVGAKPADKVISYTPNTNVGRTYDATAEVNNLYRQMAKEANQKEAVNLAERRKGIGKSTIKGFHKGTRTVGNTSGAAARIANLVGKSGRLLSKGLRGAGALSFVGDVLHNLFPTKEEQAVADMEERMRYTNRGELPSKYTKTYKYGGKRQKADLGLVKKTAEDYQKEFDVPGRFIQGYNGNVYYNDFDGTHGLIKGDEIHETDYSINGITSGRPQYYAERNLRMFDDGAAIKSGLVNAGWSHGYNGYNFVNIPQSTINLDDYFGPDGTNLNKGTVNARAKQSTGIRQTTGIKANNGDVNINADAVIRKPAPAIYNNSVRVPYNRETAMPKTVTIPKPDDNKSKGFNLGINVGDIISAGSNILGSVLSYNANNKALSKMNYASPIMARAAKLKTNYNINPQLDEIREQLGAYERDIDGSTASSRVALARKQRGRLSAELSTNKLYGEKENKETELINKDRLNQQGVNLENVRTYNSWAREKAAFDNAIAEKKAENTTSLIGNINAGIQDIIGRGEKRKADRQNRLITLAAYPHVNPRILKDFGINISDDDVKAWERAYLKRNI